MILLAIDTCGLTGSIALGQLEGVTLTMLGESELPGRTAAATLLPAVRDLLAAHSLSLGQLHSVLVVNGPGSFTGIRIGLSAAQGLCEGLAIPIFAVSRLDVLAALAKTQSAALDAHRDEVFLRIRQTPAVVQTECTPHAEPSEPSVASIRELLATRELLADHDRLVSLRASAERIAVCDSSAAAIVRAAWPDAELVEVAPPTAADALRLALPRILSGASADPLLLDANYLRRSDAEIFSHPLAPSNAGPASTAEPSSSR